MSESHKIKGGNSSLARRLPGFDARHATRRARNLRGTVLLIGVVVACTALTIYLVSSLGSSGSTKGAARGTTTSSSSSQNGKKTGASITTTRPTVTAAEAPWQLSAPISGALVLRGLGTQLSVLGGMTTGGTLAEGAFTFDTSTGKLVHVGNLENALTDSSGAVIAGQDLVFGGSSPIPLSTVQDLAQPGAFTAAGGTSRAGTIVRATVVGTLPQACTDAAVATIGTTTYLVGGYNGTSSSPQVLATTDGRTFVAVASLAQPVRFAAVAAVAGKLYVFGGQTVSQSIASPPLDTIQLVEPAKHRTRIVGHLSEPLAESTAVTVGSHVFLIGGVTVNRAPGSSTSHSAGSTTGSTGGISTSTVPTIWSFNASKDKVSRVANLVVPVSQAGTAVLGSEVWVMGGMSNGAPVTSVQTIVVAATSGARRRAARS